jgi:DNA-binding NtrC family response regulator
MSRRGPRGDLPETAVDEESLGDAGKRGAVPGLAVVHCQGRAVLRRIPLQAGRAVIGRLETEDDAMVSREHVEVRLVGGVWYVRDLGSRNGTWLDGKRLTGERAGARPTVIRIGQTLLLASDDVSRLPDSGLLPEHDLVAGRLLREAIATISDAARHADSLLVLGESGSGKELAARVFHRARACTGPVVAVNCAAIPSGMAERLFLGARRGAYSGAAADAPGYFEAAEGGVLFLDEIGELDLDLQAKLLRVLETREVLALGATRPRRIDCGVCLATHRDLPALIAAGRFRADLYYRIARPTVTLPPLRQRPEEIPFLVERALATRPLPVKAQLVEACLLRPWPGNVRELLSEIREALSRAHAEAEGTLKPQHLSPTAGLDLTTPNVPASSPAEPSGPSGPSGPQSESRTRILEALELHDHNLTAAAAALGMHRTQLYRELRRLDISPRRRLR